MFYEKYVIPLYVTDTKVHISRYVIKINVDVMNPPTHRFTICELSFYLSIIHICLSIYHYLSRLYMLPFTFHLYPIPGIKFFGSLPSYTTSSWEEDELL